MEQSFLDTSITQNLNARALAAVKSLEHPSKLRRSGILMFAVLLFSLIPFAGRAAVPDTLFREELNLQHKPAAYDSIIADWHAKILEESIDAYLDKYINLDTANYFEAVGAVTEAEYRRRLQSLASPIHLPFNDVIKKYILAYTNTHKGVVRRMLGESKYYFPIFEEELEKAGLPLEFKFLPVIESALQPAATSRMGAVGLWQFMLPTGRQYGLEITSLIDERRDPVASTKAACAFLKDLYKIYGDWTLVLASYNYGPGNVNKALKRAGDKAKTYWDIYPYLPKETRNYVPAFVAVVYAYYYHKEHNLIGNTPTIPLSTDTVMITQNMHFEQVSSTLDIPLELVQMLNPQYKQDIVPGATKDYPLVLPQQEITRFIELEAAIYDKDSIYMVDYLRKNPTMGTEPQEKLVAAASTSSGSGSTYKIKSGDTLGAIGKKYRVTVNQLMKWNNISSPNKLRVGQVIRVSP